MEAYLDNAATTRVFDSATRVMVEALQSDYGNPSSMHIKGVDAERYVRNAREIIAGNLKCEPKEIVFTSGGTESNNTAIFGAVAANKRRGRHIITTSFEHDSVAKPMAALEEDGYEVTYLPVDEEGIVDPGALEAALRDDTILVSVMYVNNEIGAVQPIAEIAKIVHAKRPETLFHVDAIQAFGKIRIRPAKMGIDLMSVSAHKIHGPKGVGFLYISDKAKVKPFVLGGGQQNGMRSGTENVPGIAGMGAAVAEMYTDHSQKIAQLVALRNKLVKGAAEIEGVTVNGPARRVLDGEETPAQAAPHVVSLSFSGIRAEVLLHALEDAGIYTSAGSACSTNHVARTHSRTLVSIGMDPALLESTLRFSFSVFNTEEEVDYVLAKMQELVPRLRQFTRR